MHYGNTRYCGLGINKMFHNTRTYSAYSALLINLQTKNNDYDATCKACTTIEEFLVQFIIEWLGVNRMPNFYNFN